MLVVAISSNIKVRLALEPSTEPIKASNVKPWFVKRLATFDDVLSLLSSMVSSAILIILWESVDISVKTIIGMEAMVLVIAVILTEGVR